MFTVDFGMRLLDVMRDVFAGSTGPSCTVGLLGVDFAEGDLLTAADAIAKEAAYPGYARQSLAGLWSLPYLWEGKPTIWTPITVWVRVAAVPWTPPGGLVDGNERIIFRDGDDRDLRPEIFGYFLLLESPGVELVDVKKFDTSYTLEVDAPPLQFAPTIRFKKTCA